MHYAATSRRIWEIDFIRGIAILLMILFHLIVDLKDFFGFQVEYLQGFWYLEGKLSAILFMIMCGVSSTLGRSTMQHGIKVFTWAMLLTAVTYIYNPSCYIRFGILHFLGISLLSAGLIRRLSSVWIFILSFVSILIGISFSERFVSNPYVFPLGLMTNTFISLDYYPLFPWYGVFLFGIIVGKIGYDDKVSLIQRPIPPFKNISWLGQHSLAIYLIHQPLLLSLLYLIL